MALVPILILTSVLGSARAQFLPPNSARIPMIQRGDLPPSVDPDRARAEATLREFARSTAPLFAARGWTLTMDLHWEDPQVNAQATRDADKNPVIRVYGGLLRHPRVLNNPDVLSVILCHEVGHFLGGAPKQLRGNSGLRSWSSAEGEADYFAGAKCVSHVLGEPPGGDPRSRAHAASLAATLLYSDVTGFTKPSLDSHDGSVAPETILNGYPAIQCRLDTIVDGLACPIPDTEPLDDEDPSISACGRPACWFRPQP